MSPTHHRLVYLDHAATTPIRPEVFRAMRPFFISEFGNPSALYDLGIRARQAIDKSRENIASSLHTTPDTITFTSGGTESNNLAIFGVAMACSDPSRDLPLKGEVLDLPLLLRRGLRGGHIITTPIEHDSVLGPIKKLAKDGWKVTYLSVDKNGLVKSEDVRRAVCPETVLVSTMYANNEIGTIEPIVDIGRIILRYRKEHNSHYPYFHTDACQAAPYLDLDVEKLHVDLMTLTGSKIYGPKGAGLLYVRRAVKLEPLFYGGNQEQSLRPGTENVAGIVGLAKALELVQKTRKSARGWSASGWQKMINLTEYFWNQLQEKIPGVKLNGPEIGEGRLPNNLNIEFTGVEAEALLLYLNEAGIMCSTSSACGLESNEPSHVLRAIGLSKKDIRETIRFTLGLKINRANITRVVLIIESLIKKIFKL